MVGTGYTYSRRALLYSLLVHLSGVLLQYYKLVQEVTNIHLALLILSNKISVEDAETKTNIAEEIFTFVAQHVVRPSLLLLVLQ